MLVIHCVHYIINYYSFIIIIIVSITKCNNIIIKSISQNCVIVYYSYNESNVS